MPSKIPRIDNRVIEAWNRDNPKIGFDAAKIPLKKVGMYGNYNLRDKLMELIVYLKDQYNVVVVKKGDFKYFKILEQEILNLAIEMVKML